MSEVIRRIISTSPVNNSQQVVVITIDENGKRTSKTVFEPIDAKKPIKKRTFPKDPK